MTHPTQEAIDAETPTVVERVARAIVLHEYEGRRIWSETSRLFRARYLAHARAAIEAMREPPPNYQDFGTDKMWKDRTSADVWRDMIDAMLSTPLPEADQ